MTCITAGNVRLVSGGDVSFEGGCQVALAEGFGRCVRWTREAGKTGADGGLITG